jgi:hypothetical protein
MSGARGMLRFKTQPQPRDSSTGYPWADGDVLFATDLNAAVAPINGGTINGALHVTGTLTAATGNFTTLNVNTLDALGTLYATTLDAAGTLTTLMVVSDTFLATGLLQATLADFTTAASDTFNVGTIAALGTLTTVTVTSPTLTVSGLLSGNSANFGTADAHILNVGTLTSEGTLTTVTVTSPTLTVVGLLSSNSANFGTADVGSKALLSAVLTTSYTNDVAASLGGVVIGQIYRNGSVLMVRVS